MTSSPRRPERQVDPAAADALHRSDKIAVATDADDETLAATVAAAVRLAAEYNLSVVLYDRSEETWMDHPHPKGVCDRSELDQRDKAHLVDQMRLFDDASVPVSAWISTVPSITEIVDVVLELGVDTILLPTDTDHPKLLDRLKRDQPADVVERMMEHNFDAPVAVLTDDGEYISVVSLAADG